MQKRFSHGLTFSANYTLSKNIQAMSYVNARTPAPTRVLTSFDRPQRLSFSPSYELPFGPGRQFLNSRNGVVRRLVGGWQVLANTVFQSGAPMGVPSSVWVLGDPTSRIPRGTACSRPATSTPTAIVRNVLPGEAAGIRGAAAQHAFGPRRCAGDIRDQWATTYDASVIKNTRIREDMNCQFRFEAFNALNTPVFSSDPNLTPTSTNFGKIIRDNGQNNAPRSLQFGFRFMFYV